MSPYYHRTMLNKGMSRRRLRSLIVWMAAVVVAASCSSSDRSSPPVSGETDSSMVVTGSNGEAGAGRPGLDASAVMSGVAVPGGNPESLSRVETAIGTDVSVVRVFARWNTPFPDADHQKILDSGHRVHLSVRPRTDSGEVIAWADMASAEPGSRVYDQMLDWADKIVEMGPGNYFTLNHEPETRDSAGNGTADEYVAAWRALVPMVRAAGGADIRTVWVMTGGPFETAAPTSGTPGTTRWTSSVPIRTTGTPARAVIAPGSALPTWLTRPSSSPWPTASPYRWPSSPR